MATTDLKLDEPGSLPKPGPVGRVVRLLFGLLCLWFVSELTAAAGSLIASNGHVLPLIWELYLFGHLGLSFVLAAAIGTPGCEMRALHDLYSRITGNPTKEHYCPVGPFTRLISERLDVRASSTDFCRNLRGRYWPQIGWSAGRHLNG